MPTTTTRAVLTWDSFRELSVAQSGKHATGGTKKQRLSYLALGLCGEAGEVHVAVTFDELREELGDLVWYMALIEHVTGMRVQWPTEAVSDASRIGILVHACGVAECVKRLAQGRPMPVGRMRTALRLLAMHVGGIAVTNFGNLGNVLEANVEKLKGIYGKKFTVKKARARREKRAAS